jgi:hypothetical protein
MRLPALVLVAALTCAVSAAAQSSGPSAKWLVEARCVHLHEGPWSANTGNGHFGGLQFSAQTWMRLHGKRLPAFVHPGDPSYPFSASPQEQLHRAWMLWLSDGRSWRSWGAVGAACSESAP